MEKTKVKCRKIADGNLDGWVILDPDDPRTKYSEDFLKEVEFWIIEGNEKIKVSPYKNDILILHDRQGNQPEKRPARSQEN